MAADGPYGEFYDFYSVIPEYFGCTLVFQDAACFYPSTSLSIQEYEYTERTDSMKEPLLPLPF
jgi:hypothetical protein